MAVERTDTLVIGGGQAGVAMSEHLGKQGVPHLVLERGRIAERWRSERWDSLVMNGPAWHDRFPGMSFDGEDPDSFPGKERVADYFVDYARMIEMPIREGVEVMRVTRNEGRAGFTAETSDGVIEALRVVAATGPFQQPVIPPIVAEGADVVQMHSAQYKNPGQLADGAVLVVGAGSSGVQIADELNKAGRKVYLSVGPHDRPPRSYRGRDFVWWLGVLNMWDAAAPPAGAEHVTIAVSGAEGGHTVDFRKLAEQGIILVGRTEGFDGVVMRFAGDLVDNVNNGDANLMSVLDAADAYVARNRLDLPEEPEARKVGPDPDCMVNPQRTLDLKEAGVTTILWATGFKTDYSWLKVDAFDENAKPIHQRGVSSAPDVYFVGLPWLSRRGSSFIWGVWHDAKFIADQIAIQRGYAAYKGPED
ncbi:NAD(P)/FAD-dependent oxidoreductase [Alisedimentitalea sp. MJ-SS2]|uniref:flavin-containing monooxygenase n=1 Tax=Aliisedimentitalea sp. MJ-SS2 TaxID=3049795 RepID=UPI0029159FB8|nr:NAD(P)/FAD-dependent oxidoreductase [Alisedimentitalea sp. MJ-SS2]MDU8928682.1 NAD(P)/FAD-dependent oxidoreductase [Alisedimentitalea sp. MJ-SS2]